MLKSFFDISFTLVIIIVGSYYRNSNLLLIFESITCLQSNWRVVFCLVEILEESWNIRSFKQSHKQFWSEVLTNSDARPLDIKAWDICFPFVVSLTIIVATDISTKHKTALQSDCRLWLVQRLAKGWNFCRAIILMCNEKKADVLGLRLCSKDSQCNGLFDK